MPIRTFVPQGTEAVGSLVRALRFGGEPLRQLHVYASFMTAGWLNAASPAIKAADEVTIRVGLDIPATPESVLIDLRDAANANRRDIRLIRSKAGIFHPKVYSARYDSVEVTVVGSANASNAAFGTNAEACLVIEGSPGSEHALAGRDLISQIESRAGAVAERVWTLPEDALPVVKPKRLSAVTFLPELVDAIDTDGWADDEGFRTSEVIAQFNAPVSGIYGYADDTGRQAGVYIPVAVRQMVRLALGAYGARMILAWRFVSEEGATIFAKDVDKLNVVPTGAGPRSHNLAITATRGIIATPVTKRLRSLGVDGQRRFNATYRLDLSGEIPRLWLLYQIVGPIASFDVSEIVG